ncbi:MAG TPA: hypothetical protein PK629_12200 [Oscillospiraceae bacterium]|nr:hypothetical protein [Oscillospiraceae bacterium]HPK36551.1 hypothetical protein [Oscillospiraceae bacterium]HPR76633.1 hypothetical protein [Oscillospiraceae bacterium]
MKRILVVLLASLLLIGAFIPMKRLLITNDMKNAEFGMSRLISDSEIDRLYIGSSIFRQGLDVNTIGEKVSGSNFLLSYNGNQPCLEALELKYLIDHGVRIGTLYVDMYAYTLVAGVSLSDDRMFLDTDFQFMKELYRTLSENGKAGMKELFEMVVTANNELFLTWPISYPLINSRYLNGSGTAVTEGRTAEDLEKLPINTENTTLNSVQVQGLYDIALLCRENDIDLMFIETPKYRKAAQNQAYPDIMTQYMALLTGENVRMIVSSETYAAYLSAGNEENAALITTYEFDCENASYFQDLIHLSTEGKETFSTVLADLIEK